MARKPIPAAACSEQTNGLPVLEKRAQRSISKGEVLLAGLVALAMFTGLLLRLPYRSALLNGLLAGGVLTSFYFYLRLRLGIRLPMKLFSCFLFSIVIDMVGNQFGLFSTRIAAIPYDTITHFVTSGLSLLPVMWLLMELVRRFDYRLPLGFIAFFSVTTTFSLGAYYEITELLDERFFGGHRIWTPRDTVQDLAADLVGIIVAAVCYTLAIRNRWYSHLRSHQGRGCS
jgi:hypothetical protein